MGLFVWWELAPLRARQNICSLTMNPFLWTSLEPQEKEAIVLVNCNNNNINNNNNNNEYLAVWSTC